MRVRSCELIARALKLELLDIQQVRD